MSACRKETIRDHADRLIAEAVGTMGYAKVLVAEIFGVDRREVDRALARYRERVEQRETTEMVEDIANDPAYRDDQDVSEWLMQRSSQREVGVPPKAARKPGNDDLEKALTRHLRSIKAMRPTGDDVARIERLVHQLSTISQA